MRLKLLPHWARDCYQRDAAHLVLAPTLLECWLRQSSIEVVGCVEEILGDESSATIDYETELSVLTVHLDT